MKKLIDHYVQQKTLYSPLPAGLADKMARIERAFASLGVDCSGSEIVTTAMEHWQGCKPGTIRRYLVQLRAVLRMAEADGLIAKAPRIPLPYVHDAVDIDITTDGANRLLRWVRFNEPRWYPLVLVLMHTGARLGEALDLHAGSFTGRGVVISKPVDRRSKTIQRVIPYTPRMQELYSAIIECEPWVCREDFSLRLYPDEYQRQSVSTVLGRVIDSAVVALGLNPLRVHDLRHCMAVLLAEAGGDLSDIASVLGHSSVAMSARYRGFVPARASGLMTAMT
jgi:integrase